MRKTIRLCCSFIVVASLVIVAIRAEPRNFEEDARIDEQAHKGIQVTIHRGGGGGADSKHTIWLLLYLLNPKNSNGLKLSPILNSLAVNDEYTRSGNLIFLVLYP